MEQIEMVDNDEPGATILEDEETVLEKLANGKLSIYAKYKADRYKRLSR